MEQTGSEGSRLAGAWAMVIRMRIGFIGLGNVGGKLAGSLVRGGFAVGVHDAVPAQAEAFLEGGAAWAPSAEELARGSDVVITCLPSPDAVSEVLEGAGGVLEGLGPKTVWIEMSTTDASEMKRLGARVESLGGRALEAPVSGGCHRAATGNISILVGGKREVFEEVLPLLQVMGRRVLHTGPLGSASVLKVVTNFLASTHLVALGEALMVAARSGIDLTTAYEAIRISSGNSFVHETESQVILNGSYDINFTMDLVVKDVGLFDGLARELGVPADLSPQILDIFREGQEQFGGDAWSSMIVKRLEDACGTELRAPGFPAQLVDDEPEVRGEEVVVKRPAGDR